MQMQSDAPSTTQPRHFRKLILSKQLLPPIHLLRARFIHRNYLRPHSLQLLPYSLPDLPSVHPRPCQRAQTHPQSIRLRLPLRLLFFRTTHVVSRHFVPLQFRIANFRTKCTDTSISPSRYFRTNHPPLLAQFYAVPYTDLPATALLLLLAVLHPSPGGARVKSRYHRPARPPGLAQIWTASKKGSARASGSCQEGIEPPFDQNRS